MTNQEKIDDLVPIITANGKFLPMCIMSNYQCRSKVMQMAEWKDSQFKEYLEKKRQEIVSVLEDITEEDARYFAFYQRYFYLGVIIDELFGE